MMNEQLKPLSSNALTALADVFYKPEQVFNALAVKNNWSWLPFILIAVLAYLANYYYFEVVDFEWYSARFAELTLGDVSPAERENFMSVMNLKALQLTQSFSAALVIPVVGSLILAAYLHIVCMNDDKNIQGFTDWYGATWWISMPATINSVLTLLILSFTSIGSQVQDTVLAPLSLAFVFSTDFSSGWHNLLLFFNVVTFWSIFLTAKCLTSWTNFSVKKAYVVATIPVVCLAGISWLSTSLFS